MMNFEPIPIIRVKSHWGGCFDWSMKPGNLEDLRHTLKQIEEYKWPGPHEGADYCRFEITNNRIKGLLKDEIWWAEEVQRRPWRRPLRVVLVNGFFLGLMVFGLIGFVLSIIDKISPN